MNTKDINKFLDDVKDAFVKAIGTSSSINEERDERSVENYVRTGGNTMENTTEPDPKGDIAITKAYPDATNDSKNTVDQMTRPEGDVKVSDAPEGPVPTQETMPSDATSAIAPSSEEMAEAVEKSATCKECGQALPMAKAEDLAKAEESAETPKEEEAEKPEHDIAEHGKPEMKKSLWGGAFSPVK